MPIDLSTLPIYFLEVAHGEPLSLMDRLLHSNLFNFALAVAFLAWVFKKFNVFGNIDTQREKIAQEIEVAERQRKLALDQLEDLKRRTANLSGEVEGILKTARESAETLSAQMIENARLEAAKIVDSSKKRVEMEQKAAMKSLEARLLNDSLQEVRETLTRDMNQKTQERSVESFLDELSHVKT